MNFEFLSILIQFANPLENKDISVWLNSSNFSNIFVIFYKRNRQRKIILNCNFNFFCKLNRFTFCGELNEKMEN